MSSPIAWVGGKYRLAPKLVNLFPRHSGYVEVFGGGASVLFEKNRAKWEVLNDYNSELINFWKTVKENPEEFIKSFEYTLLSRVIFNEYKEIYKSGKYDNDLQRAHIFYYLVKAGFASEMKDPSFGTARQRSRLKMENIERDINIAYERLRTVMIENDSFEKIIPRYDGVNTLFFLDPPYREARSYAGGGFPDENYVMLRDLCRDMKGKFLLTINEDEYIQELFKDFEMLDHDVYYSMSKKDNTRRGFGELIITNYNPLNI